jgi:DnaJ-class molecular chaperone
VTDEVVDYYNVLGVPYGATGAEITRAYRGAIKRIHPDRQRPEQRAAAEERAKLLNRAFTTLSRPERRRAYDTTLKAQVVQDQLMGRYVGGFSAPGAAPPRDERLRRPPTRAERREQRRSDRVAVTTLLIVCGAVALAVVGMLILWAALSALVGSVT